MAIGSQTVAGFVPRTTLPASLTGSRDSLPFAFGQAPAGASNPLAFALFVAVNAVLFIQPSVIFVDWADVPIYQYTILACLAVSLPRVLDNLLSVRKLTERPMTLCVLGLFALIPVSVLGRLTFADTLQATYDFGKVVVYFLLLLCNVTTAERIRRFLGWLVIFIVILTSIAVVQWGVLQWGWPESMRIPSVTMFQYTVVDKDLGLEVYRYRLRSVGVLNDPNDLCLVLTLGMAVCLYRFTDRNAGLLRIFWLAPIGLFGCALALTESRGGFLGLTAGLLILFHARFGWKKTLALSAISLPALFFAFGGRQTNFDLSNAEESGQSRLQYWSEALVLFKESPLRGIGTGQFYEQVGHVVHNSFLHAFVELGVAGGVFFIGAFYLALRPLYMLRSNRWQITNLEMRRLRPYLLAIVAAYAAGLFSLSRNYVVPTYLVLGLASVYIPAAGIRPPLPMLNFSPRLLVRVVMVSFAVLMVIYVFVRLFVRYGS